MKLNKKILCLSIVLLTAIVVITLFFKNNNNETKVTSKSTNIEPQILSYDDYQRF